jgi:hypothetical protein
VCAHLAEIVLIPLEGHASLYMHCICLDKLGRETEKQNLRDRAWHDAPLPRPATPWRFLEHFA